MVSMKKKESFFSRFNPINLIKPGKSKNESPISFSLLLITTSEKLEGKIDLDNVNNGERNIIIQQDETKTLINDSRYFLLNADIGDILTEATSTELPSIEKKSLFIVKIKGEGTPEISKYQNKSWLQENITSKNCEIKTVLHLLDVSIAEKFCSTI